MFEFFEEPVNRDRKGGFIQLSCQSFSTVGIPNDGNASVQHVDAATVCLHIAGSVQFRHAPKKRADPSPRRAHANNQSEVDSRSCDGIRRALHPDMEREHRSWTGGSQAASRTQHIYGEDHADVRSCGSSSVR